MVRFSAAVEQRGPNPFVGVPGRVSEEFLPYAAAGRIRVGARLAGGESFVDIPCDPRAGEARRTHPVLPGGVRSAAGVKVGDTVTIDVQPLSPLGVGTPSD